MSIVNGHARWAFDFISWKPTLNDLKLAVSLIQPEEKQRLAKFMFQEDFKASLAGRLLMRHFVKCATGADNDRITFGRDARGKPYLMVMNDGASNWANKVIDFNVSHQGSFACLAGYIKDRTNHNVETKVGVDVMKIEYTGGKSLYEFFRLMTRNFSPGEWSHINSFNSNTGKLEAFMRNWCLKESYVKNIGTGITIDLQKLDFIIGTPELKPGQVITDTKLKIDGQYATNFTFEESLIDREHCVAVSIRNLSADEHHQPFTFQLIDFKELIKCAKLITAIDENYCVEILAKDTKER